MLQPWWCSSSEERWAAPYWVPHCAGYQSPVEAAWGGREELGLPKVPNFGVVTFSLHRELGGGAMNDLSSSWAPQVRWAPECAGGGGVPGHHSSPLQHLRSKQSLAVGVCCGVNPLVLLFLAWSVEVQKVVYTGKALNNFHFMVVEIKHASIVWAPPITVTLCCCFFPLSTEGVGIF